MQAERVVRKEEVEAVTGLTERTIRAMEAEGTFPKRFLLNPGGRAVGWRSTEIQEWIGNRAASRTVE